MALEIMPVGVIQVDPSKNRIQYLNPEISKFIAHQNGVDLELRNYQKLSECEINKEGHNSKED